MWHSWKEDVACRYLYCAFRSGSPFDDISAQRLAFKQSLEAAGLSFDFDRDGPSCVFIDC